MKSYERLLIENKAWVQEQMNLNPNFFKELARGQSPEFFWIGSSDSRVPANIITNTEPGAIIEHRTIANMVVNTDLSTMSILQYAIETLKVEHIIICGHYGCEWIGASMNHDSYGLMNKWLNSLKDIYRLYQQELEAISDLGERERRLTEINVKEQVLNLAKTSIVQKAWSDDQRPSLHGWIYDLDKGLLKALCTMEPNSEIDDIYKYNLN